MIKYEDKKISDSIRRLIGLYYLYIGNGLKSEKDKNGKQIDIKV